MHTNHLRILLKYRFWCSRSGQRELRWWKMTSFQMMLGLLIHGPHFEDQTKAFYMTPWSKFSDTHTWIPITWLWKKDTVKRKHRKKYGETPVLGPRDTKEEANLGFFGPCFDSYYHSILLSSKLAWYPDSLKRWRLFVARAYQYPRYKRITFCCLLVIIIESPALGWFQACYGGSHKIISDIRNTSI